VLLNRDLSPRRISWWNSDYLCPADPRVLEYHKALVRRILGEWGFDGLKLDGQHMNAVPRCYNPAHHHPRPEDSEEALPDFFRELYATARSVKARRLGGILSLRHRLFVFHHAALQYVGSVRSRELVSGSFQGQDPERASWAATYPTSATTSN
jgi:hypothetical protein